MSPGPVILFRKDLDSEDEMSVARRHLLTVESRCAVPEESCVVGRYSVLPFYRELERDLLFSRSHLINSWSEHSFIADLFSWSGPTGVIADITPRSWRDWSNLPESQFVLKGSTNSRKQCWNTHMFAPTRLDVPTIARRLLDDTMIREQGLVVREYVPLVKLGEGLNGLPITNEWRTFWLATGSYPRTPNFLGSGFYWQGSHPELEADASFDGAWEICAEAARRIAYHAVFFVLDVAQTESGKWIVVEINDGQMSGLCGCDPEEIYGNLAKFLVKH